MKASYRQATNSYNTIVKLARQATTKEVWASLTVLLGQVCQAKTKSVAMVVDISIRGIKVKTSVERNPLRAS
jgi:hypothetical protein